MKNAKVVITADNPNATSAKLSGFLHKMHALVPSRATVKLVAETAFYAVAVPACLFVLYEHGPAAVRKARARFQNS